MSTDIYPRSQTGLLLVDPYNDFLAPNGKLWPQAKEVAEEVDLLTNLKSIVDKANWWAAYALWAFRLFGHEKVKLVDGGRDKWIAEGRSLTNEIPACESATYAVPSRRNDSSIRAFKDDAFLFDRKWRNRTL
jgi:hypothetical protein